MSIRQIQMCHLCAHICGIDVQLAGTRNYETGDLLTAALHHEQNVMQLILELLEPIYLPPSFILGQESF